MTKNKPEPDFLEELRKLAKEKLKSKVVPLRPDMDVAELVADLRSHQIELEMQNEQLRRMQVELEESRHKYTDLFDFAPIGYFLFDKKGLIIEANLNGAEMLGMERILLMRNKPFSSFVDKQDRDVLYFHQQKIFTEGEKAECELRLVRKDKTYIYGRLISEPIKDVDGNIIRCRTAVIDRTKRKQAEEALRESEERHRRLIENLKGTHFIYVHDTKGVFTYLSEAITEILGYTADEFKTHYSKYMTDHPVNQAVHQHTELSIQGIRQPPYEVNVRHKDGSIHWLEVQEVPVFDSQGNVVAVEGVARDITWRKRAEEKLRESERTIRAIVETSKEWIWAIDLEGFHTYCNPAIEKILGYKPEELTGHRSFDFMHEEDRKQIAEKFPLWIKQKRGWTGHVIRWRHKNGSYRYLESNAVAILDSQGNLTGFQGVDRDITERKQAEDELKQTRQQLQDVIDGTNAAIVLVKDLEGKYIVANQCFEKLVGMSGEKLRGKTDYDVLPRGQADICRGFDKQALESGPIQVEETLTSIDGREHVFLAHKFPLYDSQGKAYAVCTIAPEITDRKQLEQGLLKARDGLEARVKERTEDLNEAIGLLQDEIDKREKAQEQLSKSEQRYRSLVEASAQIIWTTNAKGIVVEECPSWNTFTGQTFADAKGLGWFDAIHPDDREYAKALMREVIKAPKIVEAELRVRRHDGQYRFVTAKGVPIMEKDGGVREWIGTCIDITERKQTQEKIEQDSRKMRSLTTQLILAEEQQRRKIAELLHDSIGPLLAFSERQLEDVAKQAPEKMVGVLEEVKHYINDATRQTRSLIFELSPLSLDDFGLEAAVEELAEQFAKEHKLKLSLKISDAPKPLTDETKILLYRSIREILVNTVKHAEAGTLRISLAPTDKDIVIAIKDDGKGFDSEQLESRPAKSRGLGLFSIRERLHQIGGCLQIQSQEGKGTTITLTAPLNQTG